MYAPVEAGAYTVAYDLYMRRVLADSGAWEIFVSDEPGDEKLQKALTAIANSGKVCHILAGFVKPHDAPWTAEWATETAARFDTLTSRDDRDALLGLLLKGMQGFFRVGPRSSVTSR